MAAKSLAFLVLAILFVFGYPPGIYAFDEYEDNSNNLDVHTDSNEYEYDFTPDESDINYDALALEQKEINSHERDKEGQEEEEHDEDNSMNEREDTGNDENQHKTVNTDNEKDRGDSQNNDGHDAIKTEDAKNPDKIPMEDLQNKQLREELMRAEHNDNIKKINEVDGNKKQEESDKNNNEASERPIKEIHDTIEARSHHHIIHKGNSPLEHHVQDTNKHDANHNGHKEQKVKISKLIFAARKNEEDAKHSESSEKQESPPTLKNPEPSPTPKSQAWVNEIVTSDGGLLHLQQHTKKVDVHKDSNSHEEVKVQNEQKNNADESMSQHDKVIEQKKKVDDENNKQPESVVHKDENNQDDVNQIRKSDSEGKEGESEEQEDDKRILGIPRFQELQKRYISQYLNDHYSGQNISDKLRKQITDLITTDLKQQWREREKEALKIVEERDKQTKDAIHSAENSEKEDKQKISNNGRDDQIDSSQEREKHTENSRESEDQRQDSQSEEKQKENNNESKDEKLTKYEEKNPNEETERKPELINKHSTEKSRPTKSILSNMLRSSLSLPVHDKSHDSSMITARSSPLPVAMDTKDSTRSDNINLTPASVSVADMLSTETSHNEESRKRPDDSFTDIFADEEKKESELKKDNNIKQDDDLSLAELLEPLNTESIPNGKMFKVGEPFNLSVMSDPDPKINKLIQLPMFQQLRKQQVESYLDAQFAGKYISEEELRGVEDVISQSMIKDLNTEGSGLHAWIKDSMGGDDTEEEPDKKEDMDSQAKTKHQDEPQMNNTQESDNLASSEEPVSDDKSEPAGMLQGAVDLMKSKRNNWMKILSAGQQNTSTLPENDNVSDDSSSTSANEKKNIDQEGGGENNKNDSEDSEAEKETVEKEVQEEEANNEPSKGYLDAIWGFFGSSEENVDAGNDKDNSEGTKSDGETKENVQDIVPPADDGDGDEQKHTATRSDDDGESLVLAVAEDYEEETVTSQQDNISAQTTKKMEMTHLQDTSEKTDSMTTTLHSTSGKDLETKETDVINKTSELVDTAASEEHKVDPTSTTHLTEGLSATTVDTSVASEESEGSANESKLTMSNISSGVFGKSDQASTQAPLTPVESVDLDHEKSKYKDEDAEHEHTDVRRESDVVEDDANEGESDPLKKLCKKYPTLKACQASPTLQTPTGKTEDTSKMDSTFLLYIKHFTRSLNGFIYGVFAYAVQCVKSLVKVLCYYTIGIFLNIIGKEQVSHSMNEMFDSTSTEYFAVIMFLVINHTVFYWYFKNSTMHPVVKVADGFNDLDNKQLQILEDQLKELKKKMAEETRDKKDMQEQVAKEIDINQKMHNENKELKIYMDENKGDKKRIKELERSIRDHENRMKGKDVELEKLRVSIETVKEDMKGQKDGYKELEEKFRYVEKELDSKDQTLYDMEESKKEMVKDLSNKDKDITEKTDMLKDLNERVTALQGKQSEMENSIKVEKEVAKSLEDERKALQETLLNIDKLNYEGKLENGFHSERIEDEDGVLNVSLDEDVKAERLQNIINAIKLKAEHLEAVNQLTSCKDDLNRYRKKSDDLEANMNSLSSKFETLSSESDELRKSIEKKDIELQTITKFFGEREAEFQRQNVSQKEELQKLSKQMDSIDEEKREMSDLIKKIDDLKEEIENNDKDYKQQLTTLEEQSHSNYLKMRNALRECDEHKREKEIYRKRLLDIDMTPQAKPKTNAAIKPGSKERSDSPSSDKSSEGLNDPSKLPSPSEPTHPTLPPPRQPFAPPMYRGPGFPPNPMAAALYRVPPVGPYSMPPRPQFMPPMRPPVPHNLLRNPSNPPMNRPNAPVNPGNPSAAPPNMTNISNIPHSTTNVPTSICNAPMGAPNMSTSNIPMSAPMSAPNAHMNAPTNPYAATMNSSYTQLQPGMVPYSYTSAGQRPMFTGQDGQRMSTPPRLPYGMHGPPMMPPNSVLMGGHPTSNAMARPPPPNPTLKTS